MQSDMPPEDVEKTCGCTYQLVSGNDTDDVA